MLSVRFDSRYPLCAVLGAMVAMTGVGAARAADEVQITIQGAIEPACGLSGAAGALALGDISAPGEKTLAFTVNCNAPFAYAVVSANGGLVSRSGTPVLGGDFASRKPYAVSARFQTDLGAFGDTALPSGDLTAAAAAPCLAGSFSAACPFTTSGSGVAINRGGELKLNWGATAQPLLAGAYSDTITLTVRAL